MSDYSLSEKLQLASWHIFDRMRTGLRNLKLSDPKAWNPMLWNLWGASQTESGVNVTEETAFNYSAVYNAINIIAGTIATLPIHLYKRNQDGKRKVINNHPALQCLRYRANPIMPAINYRETSIAHILAWGNCYSEKVYDGFGNIIELWPITPDRVTPKWENGTVVYKIRVSANEITAPRSIILHIPGLSYDGVIGYSVIRKAAESIGLSLASEKFGSRFFGSNTNIGGVVQYPRTLGDNAYKNIKKSLMDYTGGDNSHRWMILEQGTELKKLGFANEESQFLQIRQFQIAEIARWFHIPPHKLKDLTRSTFSNIEEQEIEFVVSCLRPWLERLEQNYNIQLLSDNERRLGYYFKHSVEGLLRGSSQARADYYTKRFYLGTITPNQIRELEDEEPLDTPNADKAYVQMNVMPLDDIDKAPEPIPKNIPGEQPPQPEEEQNSIEWAREQVKLIEYRNINARDRISKRYKPLIHDAAYAIVWREHNMIMKLIDGKGKNDKNLRANAGNLKKDIDNIYAGFESYIMRKMGPVFKAYADSVYNQSLLEIGESIDEIPDDIKLEINRFVNVYAKRHKSSSVGQLNKIIEDNEETFVDMLQQRIDEWKEKRADKISENETTRLASFVAETAFFSFGYKSYWRIRGPQTCPYCQALEGRAISSGQTFFDGGEEHEPKGAKNGPMLIRSTVMHPPLHQGCDCYISVR